MLALSCTSMDNTYRDLWSDGERIYPAAADSVAVFPGKNRIRLDWQIFNDPNVATARIYWNYDADSSVVQINATGNTDMVSATLTNMPEGPYSFTIYTFDRQSNRSVPVNVTGKVYGDSYEKTLLNKLLKSAAYEDGVLAIAWGNVDDTSLGVKLTYLSTSGDNTVLNIAADADSTYIDDFDFDTDPYLEYTTVYIPEPQAIDTFYTAPVSVKARGLKILSRNAWTATASSFDARSGSSWRPPSYTIDGSMSTAWVNEIGGTHKETGVALSQQDYPHWLQIDMGSVITFNGVTMTFASVRNETPSSIEIAVSTDGVTWTPVRANPYLVQNVANVVQFFEFPDAKTGRYFRITALTASGNTKNIFVPEVGAYTL
jgi:hypothetical protein